MTAGHSPPALRIREAGDSAVVMDLGSDGGQGAGGDPAPRLNARAIAIADAIRDRRFRGIRDVVPAFHSVGVFFNPLAADVDAIIAAAEATLGLAPAESTGALVDVPVVYGGDSGPDLDVVAAFAGCAPEDVIARHSSSAYRVFMLGFLPGFPYMAPVDATIAAPRRPMPRLRVPAGSVGIAGRQTGIYPCDSPGGWQIVGRTTVKLFDPSRASPALLSPGDRVRFVPMPDAASARASAGPSESLSTETEAVSIPARQVTVLRPGLLTTVQDGGRWGHQHLGVSVSGAMDVVAHGLANALVGNDRSAATLEVTMLGPELRFEQRTLIAVTGADLSATLEGAAVTLNSAVDCPSGSVLRFGARRTGARAYVAIDGGIAVPQVLGSRATHLTSRLGGFQGRALRAGDQLPCGRRQPDGEESRVGSPSRSHDVKDVRRGGAVRLRVLPGPHVHLFEETALERLQSASLTVSTHSDRMGYRLATIARLGTREDVGEMLSEATVMGAVQIPPSGQPILLMADRQTTGGYAQIAIVITADLPAAAQLAPGDHVMFEVCSRSAALAALAEYPGLDDGG